MTNQDLIHKRKKAYRVAYRSTYSIPQMIDLEDVDEEANYWNDVDDRKLDEEIQECLDVRTNNSQIRSARRDLAMHEWLDSMARVRMEHLTFESEEEALKERYWPYHYSRLAAVAKLYDIVGDGDIQIPNTARNRARNVVIEGTRDKLDPRVKGPKYCDD